VAQPAHNNNTVVPRIPRNLNFGVVGNWWLLAALRARLKLTEKPKNRCGGLKFQKTCYMLKLGLIPGYSFFRSWTTLFCKSFVVLLNSKLLNINILHTPAFENIMHLSLLSVAGIILAADARPSSTTCVCTTVPCPVEGKNSLNAGGGGEGVYTYALTSDGIAIVSSAKVTISSKDLDRGTDTTSCTQSYSRTMDDDGVENCDAGHILAHRLGGYGNQTINIFPQDLSINRGSYAQFENDIYDCIQSGASAGDLSWKFSYETDMRTKPYEVEYEAVFDGGDCTTLSGIFPNE
jgi:hypothetical protein